MGDLYINNTHTCEYVSFMIVLIYDLKAVCRPTSLLV